MSFFARSNYTGDGSTTQRAISFPYLSRDHITVYLDEVAISNTLWTWISDGVIDITTPPASPVAISIRRETPITSREVDYVDGATLTESDLDTADLQLLYIIQEQADQSASILAGTVDADTLDGIDSTGFALASHTHLLADVTDSGTSAALNVPAAGDAAAGEVVKGDDTRLTDARTPVAHTHVVADVTDAGTAAALDVPAAGDAAVGEVVKGDDTRLTDARAPTAHTHVKADVTDLNAIEDSDFAAAEGYMRKTGATTYEAIKSNLSATVAPGATDDTSAGYSVGSVWVDVTGDLFYVCVDATASAAVWSSGGGGGGGGGSSAYSGCVLGLTSAQTTQDINTGGGKIVSFDEASKDVGSWWSGGSPTRATVPAGVDVVNISGFAYISNHNSGIMLEVAIMKNGAAYHRLRGVDSTTSVPAIPVSIINEPVEEGDYFELRVYSANDTSVTINTQTTLRVHAVAGPDVTSGPGRLRKQVRAKVDGTQTGVDAFTSGDLPVEFAIEDYDEGAWFNPATSELNFTVPDGVTKIDASAWIVVTNATAADHCVLSIKGSVTTALARQRVKDESGTHQILVSCEGHTVTPGETITVTINTSSDTSVDVLNGWVYLAESVETIGGGGGEYSGAVATLTSHLTAQDYTTSPAIPFAGEDFDFGGWHSTSTNTDRLTVPAGVSQARVFGTVHLDNVTIGERVLVQIRQYPADVLVCQQFCETASGDRRMALSGIAQCTAGDYFLMKLTAVVDNSIDIKVNTTFGVEASAGPGVTPPTRTVQTVAAQSSVSISIPAGCTRFYLRSTKLTLSNNTANFQGQLFNTGDTVNSTVETVDIQNTASTSVSENAAASSVMFTAADSTTTDRWCRIEVERPRDSSEKTTFTGKSAGKSGGTDETRERWGAATSAQDDDTIRILTTVGTFSGDIYVDWHYT